MKQKESLNLYNSNYSANLNPYPTRTVDRVARIIPAEVALDKEFVDEVAERGIKYRKLNGKDKVKARQMLFEENSFNIVNLIKKGYDKDAERWIDEYKVNVSYESLDIFPENIIESANGNGNTFLTYVYQDKRLPSKTVRNISNASNIARTEIVVRFKLGTLDLTNLKANLYDLRYRLEAVRLEMLPITKQDFESSPKAVQDQYELFKGLYYPTNDIKLYYYAQLHETLARWQMRLLIEANTFEDAQYLIEQAEIITDKSIRKSKRKFF